MNKATATAPDKQIFPHPDTYPAPAKGVNFATSQISKHYKAVDLLFAIQAASANLKLRKGRLAELSEGVLPHMITTDFLCQHAKYEADQARKVLSALSSQYVDLLRSFIEPAIIDDKTPTA